jgi:indole-3-glycerol phosphate synthase
MGVNILSKIIDTKKSRVEFAKKEFAPELIREKAIVRRKLQRPHVLSTSLKSNDKLSIIAEFKRRSPSRGEIRKDADPQAIARSYQQGGAKAVSVLTEQDHFGGSLDDLAAVRETVLLPVLRKDFIFDEYQVYESAAAGADALLLIVSVLDDDQLVRLRTMTEDELGMDALVEVHDETEMKRAAAAGSTLIGVNNRDLVTFSVSLETSVRLAPNAPSSAVLVSESGLNTSDDLRRLSEIGYKGFLIGEALMRFERPELALRAFLGLGKD